MPTDNSYTQSNIQDSVHTHHAGPIDDDGNVRCYRHQLVAELRTSNTDKNPEREFYACSKKMSDTDRCNFFLWADELSLPSKAEAQDDEPLLQSTPSTWSQSPRSTYAPSFSLSSSPSQHPNPLEGDMYASHSTAKVSLTATPPTCYSPGRVRMGSASSSSSSCNKCSDLSSDLDQSVAGCSSSRVRRTSSTLPVGHVNSDHLGLEPLESRTWSDPPHTGIGTPEPQFTGPFGLGSISSTAPATSSELGDAELLSFAGPSTMQSTRRRVAASPRKDNGRRMSTPVVSRGIRPLSNEDPTSHTPSQQHAVPLANMTASADTVAAHLQALSALPHYIRKLERKQAASEKSMRMKSKRIAELEEEVRRLTAENANLRLLKVFDTPD